MSGPRRIDLRSLSRGPASARLAGDIAASRLVCFPTDTVYGVGGIVAPLVARSVVAAKGRDAGKPLQVVYPSLELLEASLALTPRLREAVRRLLPGPFTLLLPHPAGLAFPPPGEVPHCTEGTFAVRTRPVKTIGVRVPEWPEAAQVLAGLPFPLLASSANLSGEAAPGRATTVSAAAERKEQAVKIAAGADHGGYALKQAVVRRLRSQGHEVVDVGTDSGEASVDYPDFGHKVAAMVASGEVERGILVCGTGLGICMTANRHAGVRAADCFTPYLAEMARRHNDANVLCMGGRILSEDEAWAITEVWLATPFEGGRHERRVEHIELEAADS